MKTINKTLLASFIAASLGMAGVVAANDHNGADRTAGEVIDDAAITASVKAKLLEDERTKGFDINVDTKNGVVTLKGGADSLMSKTSATDIATTTDGVVSVNNELTVAAPGTEARKEANEATASGEVRETLSDTGEVINDAWITSKVKAQLVADEDIAGLQINVETKDNQVHLIGDVPNAEVRAEAVRIAQTTQGVAGVDASRLNVRTNPGAPR
jgi:osmotically-inducible protein OsmY